MRFGITFALTDGANQTTAKWSIFCSYSNAKFGRAWRRRTNHQHPNLKHKTKKNTNFTIEHASARNAQQNAVRMFLRARHPAYGAFLLRAWAQTKRVLIVYKKRKCLTLAHVILLYTQTVHSLTHTRLPLESIYQTHTSTETERERARQRQRQRRSNRAQVLQFSFGRNC